MVQSKALLAFVLLAGIGIGALARDAITNTTSEIPAPAVSYTETAGKASSGISAGTNDELVALVEDLQSELDIARQERNDLQQQLEQLSSRLDQLDKPISGESLGTQKNNAVESRRRGSGALTLESLTAAGISERDATAIKRRLDEIALQRLYVRDQAQREGGLGKEEYRNQIRRLNEAQNNLENEFGRDAYERYLYAVGRPNRVEVQSVIENSAAYSAGLQIGDRIIAYNNKPIYNPNEIRRGTMGGSAGEMIPIVVERNGVQTDLYIPRGPLGIQMNAASIRPPDKP